MHVWAGRAAFPVGWLPGGMTLDGGGSTRKAALHALFTTQVGFLVWYGPRGDAFYDDILGLVAMPEQLTLVNWQTFAQAWPKDMAMLRRVLQDDAVERPDKRLVLA